jgi:hypothetical protein
MPSGVHFGVCVSDLIGDGLLTLIILVVPRKSGPDLLQVHVYVIQQHLAEDSSVSIIFVVLHDNDLVCDGIR